MKTVCMCVCSCVFLYLSVVVDMLVIGSEVLSTCRGTFCPFKAGVRGVRPGFGVQGRVGFMLGEGYELGSCI